LRRESRGRKDGGKKNQCEGSEGNREGFHV
jgi:hypothetical protein